MKTCGVHDVLRKESTKDNRLGQYSWEEYLDLLKEVVASSQELIKEVDLSCEQTLQRAQAMNLKRSIFIPSENRKKAWACDGRGFLINPTEIMFRKLFGSLLMNEFIKANFP